MSRPLPKPFVTLRLSAVLLSASLCTLAAFAQQDSTLAPADSSFLISRPDTSTLHQDIQAAGFTVSSSDLDAEIAGQDVSGILRSSRDVFNSTAGYTFGAARFRIRGLGGENSPVSLNGIVVNDLENGYASWSNWGGLNDVTRWSESRTGVSSSRFGFGGLGGWSNIDLRASQLRKGLPGFLRAYQPHLPQPGDGHLQHGHAGQWLGVQRERLAPMERRRLCTGHLL
ncbi:MAG: TonB-dependent receptor plug domain-containing protein [Flavobacteriales bacterium]|nr:TonB-dependent receptor plug domain-containing protein [Flavobacteriales bacterium]